MQSFAIENLLAPAFGVLSNWKGSQVQGAVCRVYRQERLVFGRSQGSEFK